MPQKSVANITVTKVGGSTATQAGDTVAVEEPLEIRLEYHSEGNKIRKSISVTMRTPGHDAELATGFLYTEGIIKSPADIHAVTELRENVILIVLHPSVIPAIGNLERNFYTTSSCGVCGKASIEAVHAACNILDVKDSLQVPVALLYRLPALLRAQQDVFESTGGLHGCALFDTAGEIMLLHEDVGRHNALDKLIGSAFNSGMLPLSHHILLLSGRASFELVQKAAMAGTKMVAAVGAPSSLAVQMAEDWGMTLIGFLRGERFNIYSAAHRIIM
ncbi:MAG: formate dehydrogenase accessory sulfurtransferase FdhD [Bacteroidota bacterium]